MNKNLILYLMCILLTTGCSSFNPLRSSRVTWNSEIPPKELYGALNTAQKLSGITHRGGRIRVSTREGDRMSNIRPWLGRLYNDGVHRGVALGLTYNNKNMLLYTTNGKYRPETLLHEMGHILYFDAGYCWSVHHDLMRKAGFP